MPTEPSTAKAPLNFQEAYKLYEDGKHRRYELLFAVNGGAFAVANLSGKSSGLGGLRLSYLAVGMVLFTITMVVDIFTFGTIWHGIGESPAIQQSIDTTKPVTIFGLPGRVVLVLIGVFICSGWLLAGFGRP